MSNIETTLCFSPLSKKVYWQRVNKETGVGVGTKGKDVTNAFLQVMEHKFPVNTYQKITVDGKHHSTIYNVDAGVDVLTFRRPDKENIDDVLLKKLLDAFGGWFFYYHGECEPCFSGIDENCVCERKHRVNTMILDLCRKDRDK